jgi:hypothetical protein
MSTGSARAVSIISPKTFFASRADMVFTGESRDASWSYEGQNSSFCQAVSVAVERGAADEFRWLWHGHLTARQKLGHPACVYG